MGTSEALPISKYLILEEHIPDWNPRTPNKQK
jgi:hypothetical protein